MFVLLFCGCADREYIEVKLVNGQFEDGRTVGFFEQGKRPKIEARFDPAVYSFEGWEGPVVKADSAETSVHTQNPEGALIVVRAKLRRLDGAVMEEDIEELDARWTKTGLQISPVNPRVFRYDGKPFPLFGSHNNYFGQDLQEIKANFAHRHKLGLNHFRIWSDFRNFETEQPWLRVDGKRGINGSPVLDLSKENDAYFARARTIVELARDHGIVIHWMVFDEIELEPAKHRWGRNPFHPKNNINDLGLSSRRGACNGPGCFFDLSNEPLKQIQEAHVRRLVAELNPLGNVTFSVMNESTASLEWEMYWVQLIRELGGIVLTHSFSEEEALLASAALDGFAFHNIKPSRVNARFLQYYDAGKHLTYEEQATRPVRSEEELLDLIWGALLAMGSYSFDELTKDEALLQKAEVFSGHAATLYKDVQSYERMRPANQRIRKGDGYVAEAVGEEMVIFCRSDEVEVDLSGFGEQVQLREYDVRNGEVGKEWETSAGVETLRGGWRVFVAAASRR